MNGWTSKRSVAAIVASVVFENATPKQGQLLIQIEDQWKAYAVEHAAYGINLDGNTYF